MLRITVIRIFLNFTLAARTIVNHLMRKYIAVDAKVITTNLARISPTLADTL